MKNVQLFDYICPNCGSAIQILVKQEENGCLSVAVRSFDQSDQCEAIQLARDCGYEFG